jgi:hypothetical protein
VSIHFDEFTDAENCNQLLVYAMYTNKKYILEDVLFCKLLALTTKGIHAFHHTKGFFLMHEISVHVIGAVCTDVVPSMLGYKSGFAVHTIRGTPY